MAGFERGFENRSAWMSLTKVCVLIGCAASYHLAPRSWHLKTITHGVYIERRRAAPAVGGPKAVVDGAVGAAAKSWGLESAPGYADVEA